MNEKDLSISDMMHMQNVLFDKYKNVWNPMSPEFGPTSLLWMIGEIGEVIDIIKKKPQDDITGDTQIRKDFIEEMADVLMYFFDVCIKYGVTAEEFSEVYLKKHRYNLIREYNGDK